MRAKKVDEVALDLNKVTGKVIALAAEVFEVGRRCDEVTSHLIEVALEVT